LRIAMSEYVAKPDDGSRVRDAVRDGRSELAQVVHGFAADLECALDRGSGFLVRQIFVETVAGQEAHRRAGVVFDLFEVNARITRRHISGTCSARCSDAACDCGSHAIPPGRPSDERAPPALLSTPGSW